MKETNWQEAIKNKFRPVRCCSIREGKKQVSNNRNEGQGTAKYHCGPRAELLNHLKASLLIAVVR
jgi:hypothetical protein